MWISMAGSSMCKEICPGAKISATKSGKDRKVDMSAQLAEVLSDLLSKRRAEALRREMEKPAEERRDAATVVNEVMEGWLFQTPVGTQIDPSNLRKLFNRLLDRCQAETD